MRTSGACRCASADVTVIVPCHDEEQTVASVVRDFRAALPMVRVLVADNVCTDDTAIRAADAGAEVIRVPLPGKGRAVRRLFEQCWSEVVIMVDGDGTYDPSVAGELVHLVVCEGFDLVNVQRLSSDADAYRAGHRLGNRLLTELQRRLTGVRLADLLTGYKAMSRRFVTSLPIRSHRFQLEMEIAAHAVAMDFAYTEMAAPYRARPAGSESKLSTYRDGASILRMSLRLYRDLRPFSAFLLLGVPWLLGSIALVARPLTQYVRTGQVPAFPSLIAGMAAFVVFMLLLTSGWLLERTRGLRRDTLLVAANDLERRLAVRELAEPPVELDPPGRSARRSPRSTARRLPTPRP